jgi:hypothetical protein
MKKIILIILIVIGSISMIKAQNTGYGTGALYSNTTGTNNSAFGYYSMYTNTTGYCNSAIGSNSLYYNSSGTYNVANGFKALYSNTTGGYNTANGSLSLYYNTTGSYNTAYGEHSMYYNTTGNFNTANGMYALYNNTSGTANTATGLYSLYANTNSQLNTANGSYSLYSNTTGWANTATGHGSLYANTTGQYNTSSGAYALFSSTSGSFNTSIGYNSGNAVYTYTNSTSIGYNATATASNQIRIGNGDITSIGGQVSWTTLSDGRFKKNIKHDIPGLEFINKLEPVSYTIDVNAFNDFLKIPDSLRLKNNSTPITQSGFIAQDVEKILNEMNISNFSGVDLPKNENDYYGIRYAEFVVPLVKSVQELSALDKQKDLKIQEINTLLKEQEQKIKMLEKVILDAGLLSKVNPTDQLPSAMDQNQPNPFSSSTEINCFVPSNAGSAMLMIFDMNGKQIKKISITERGNCLVKVNADELSGSGMYFYSLIIDNIEISTKRMILSK